MDNINTHDLKSTVMIGKQGVTDSVISEIKNQLNAQKVIKVKILRSAKEETDRKEIAKIVAESSKAKHVDLRGNIITLSK